ncbi:MAG: FxsA family protein [Myxococcota bacterium]
MLRLLLLFIGLPALELALLIEIGSRIGTGATLGLILVTGAIGASLARGQGLALIAEVRRELAEGRLPAASLVDGLLILIAAAVLVTPGVLTDAFGFLCLVPAFRAWVKRELLRRLERAVADGRVEVSMHGEVFGSPFRGADPPMRDVTPKREDPDPSPTIPTSATRERREKEL